MLRDWDTQDSRPPEPPSQLHGGGCGCPTGAICPRWPLISRLSCPRRMVSWGPPPGYATSHPRLRTSPLCAVWTWVFFSGTTMPPPHGRRRHWIPRAALCSRRTKGSARQVRGRFVVVSAGLRARSLSAGRRRRDEPMNRFLSTFRYCARAHEPAALRHDMS